VDPRAARSVGLATPAPVAVAPVIQADRTSRSSLHSEWGGDRVLSAPFVFQGPFPISATSLHCFNFHAHSSSITRSDPAPTFEPIQSAPPRTRRC
jgi:hypothetical protein